MASTSDLLTRCSSVPTACDCIRTCSSIGPGVGSDLQVMERAISADVFVPPDWGGCGFGGTAASCDRMSPAVPPWGGPDQVRAAGVAACAPANRTGVLEMSRATATPYRHFLELPDEVARALTPSEPPHPTGSRSEPMDLIRTQDRAFPAQYTDRRESQVVAESPHCATEFSTPFPILDGEALEHNLQVMARWCAAVGLELQPHVKSTMAPRIFRRQLAAGATGLTVATPAQLRYVVEHGARNVQVAGELVQPHEAQWLATWLAGSGDRSALVWVDSVDSVEVVSRAAAGAGTVVDVLLEVGQHGGRCGIRTEDQRVAVTQAARTAPGVRLMGVCGYEGAVAGRRDEQGLAAIRGFFGRLRQVLDDCVADGSVDADLATVSAGGSMFTDLVAEAFAGQVPRAILRSGCYALHDHGLYRANSSFGPNAAVVAAQRVVLLPALTVWASVVSRPERGLALLDAGRRDLSFDQGMPTPIEVLHRDGSVGTVEGQVRTVHDQHAFLDLAGAQRLDVGDRVRLGISHPCTTMDKWSKLPVVDPQGRLVDVVTTWF